MRSRYWLTAPLVIVATLVGWGWRGAGDNRGTSAPSAEELAEAAGVSPQTLIVDFRDDVTDEMLAKNAYVEQAISRYSAVDRLYRLQFASAAEAARAAEALRRDPTVASVDYDVEATIFDLSRNRFKNEGGGLDLIDARDHFPADLVRDLADAAPTAPSPFAECADGEAGAEHRGFPNDVCYRYQWHMNQIGLPGAWKLGQGEGVVVAVIDTGVTQVPDLKATKMVPGYNFIADSDDARDDHGHGTHVAGTIAQATHNKIGVGGVAFGAAIMPLKVLSADGRGSMAAIAQAIRYAADKGAKVINMSLGGPFPVGTIKQAVDYARDRGVVVVAAAGNDGRGRVSYPAKYAGVVSVAATQYDETTTFYSNWGKEIALAAPGGNTRVDQNGDGKPDGVLQNTVVPGNISRTDYLPFMGTSMASPHVAGVAALVMGAGVTRPEKVEAILLDTARKPSTKKDAAGSRVDDHYGAGIVDAGAALKKARLAKDAGSVGLAATLSLAAAGLLRRRRTLAGKMGLGFAGALILGSLGTTEALVLMGSWGSNPLVLSALLPLLAVGVLYGVSKLRPALSGLAFGVAGALLFGAIAYVADVRFIPDALDRMWLLAHAALATALGAITLRK